MRLQDIEQVRSTLLERWPAEGQVGTLDVFAFMHCLFALDHMIEDIKAQPLSIDVEKLRACAQATGDEIRAWASTAQHQLRALHDTQGTA